MGIKAVGVPEPFLLGSWAVDAGLPLGEMPEHCLSCRRSLPLPRLLSSCRFTPPLHNGLKPSILLQTDTTNAANTQVEDPGPFVSSSRTPNTQTGGRP